MQRRGNIINLGIKELRSLWRDKVLLLFVFFAFPILNFNLQR